MQTNLTGQISAAQLRRAADLKQQIENLSMELDALLAGGSYTGRRMMSAEAKAKIAAAQRARWARARGEEVPSPEPGPVVVKTRTMSPEARAKIAAAARLRWKKAKAAGRNAL